MTNRASRSEKRGLFPFALVAVGAGLATLAMAGCDEPYFARFLGDWPPWLVVGLVATAGALALGSLQANYRFPRDEPGQVRAGLTVGAGLATLMAIPPVVIDLVSPFPREINVPWPWSLPFYLAIAFVVEVVFHLVPWAVLIGLGATLAGWLGRRSRAVDGWAAPAGLVTASLLVVSLSEPVFQVASGWSPSSPNGVDVLVGVNVWAFNVAQLLICRRYGFVAMYLTRLVFYVYWHLLWGHWRLELLF